MEEGNASILLAVGSVSVDDVSCGWPMYRGAQPKKNKKNKKYNGGSSSDSSDKENGHSFNIYAAITKATSAGRKKDDQKPLIGSEWRPLDGKEFDDRDGDSGFWTPDTENDDNQNTDTMPFGFGKKKKSSALVEKELSPPPQPSKEAERADAVAEKVEETAYAPEDANANNADQATVTVTETEVVVEEAVVDMVVSDAMDGGADHVVETEMPPEPLPVETIAEKNVETPAPVVEKQPKKQPRVESTPLIGKQTKVKDTQPGFLCCAIL